MLGHIDTTQNMNTHKYSRIAERLCQTGGLLFIIRYLVITNSPTWIFDMAWLMILAGLGFALAGQIAGRREQTAKHPADLV
jgi:hypothetical protein